MYKKLVAVLCCAFPLASCNAQEVDVEVSPPYVMVGPNDMVTETRYNYCHIRQPENNRYICTIDSFIHSPNKDRSYIMIDAATCLEYMVTFSNENGTPVTPLYSLNKDCNDNKYPFDRNYWANQSIPIIGAR